MGADMVLRDLYLPAGSTVNLPAAKATATRLCQHATVADLRTLLDRGWIDDDTPPDADACTDKQLADRADVLRPAAERVLHEMLDRFAQSLTRRDVAGTRFDHGDSPGVETWPTDTQIADLLDDAAELWSCRGCGECGHTDDNCPWPEPPCDGRNPA